MAVQQERILQVLYFYSYIASPRVGNQQELILLFNRAHACWFQRPVRLTKMRLIWEYLFLQKTD